MNRITILTLLIFVSILFCGCSENEFVEKIDKSYTVSCDQIWCIKDNSIIYSDYEASSLVFYFYDCENDSTDILGRVSNPYIYSGDLAIAQDDIFFYCNELVIDGNEERLIHTFYRIDADDKSLQEVISDDSEQTLIYVEALDDKIFSLKGKVEKNQAITFLDYVDVTANTPQYFDFVSKQYDKEEYKGEVIYNFSSYNGHLYVLVNVISEDIYSWKIEKYDARGKYIDECILSDEVSRNISENRVSKFEILGEYGFIRTFSGNGVLFELSDSDTKVVLRQWI